MTRSSHLVRRLACCALPLLVACGAPDDDRGADVRASAGMAAPAPAAAPPAATAAAPPGLDAGLLRAAYARADSLPRLHSLLVARDGEVLGEEYFRGATAGRAANVKSVSKSILSALVGIAIAEGEMRLDQPIGDFFARELQGQDARKRAITVEDLISMRAGLEGTSFGNYGRWVSSRNWVQNALAQPLVAEPGGPMIYSTGSSHLLSAALTRATGKSTLQYAREKLAGPLGFQLAAWPTDPQGIYFGGNDMRLTPRQMLRVGELYRNGGRHEGGQLVPEAWIEASWQVRGRSRWNNHGYGYGWWIREAAGRPVYFAWGYGGQFIFVVPSLRLTVVATSEADTPTRDGRHLREVHDLVDRYLIPAAERGAGP